MNKNIIKTLFISFVLVFSMAFINMIDVKAESCTCYYKGEVNAANASGGTFGTTFAEIEYVDDGSYKVKRSCDFAASWTTVETRVMQGIGECNGVLYPAENFNMDSKKIVAENCSATACGTIYHNNKTAGYGRLTTDKGGIFNSGIGFGHLPMPAVEKKEFDKGIENSQTIEDDIIDENTDIDPDKIKNWANNDIKATPSSGYNSCNLIPKSIMTFINNLFFIIQIIGIILLIVLSMIEFVKALTGEDEDGIKQAVKNTFKRIILVVILLILPSIIIWLLNMVNDNRYQKEKGNYVIGTDGNPLCK